MSTIILYWLFAVTALGISIPVKDRRFLVDETIHPAASITQTTYKAAVLNHEVIYPHGVKTRAEALEAMSKNLNIYEEQAAIAHQQNVDILVFPEDGLYGSNFTKETIQPFLERIPDPTKVSWNPCLQPTLYNGTEIQQRLSCMARNQSLYIVANMGSSRPCTSYDFLCTLHVQYNTDVVFDPSGLLVARFHKRHLHNEAYFDYPFLREATFDTAFGRFALASSRGILFHHPLVDTIEDFKVDSVAFSTRLMDTPPPLSGFQWQAAFASGLKVNLLAANHRSAGGSGIYTPTGPAVYVKSHDQGQLLTATIPSRPVPFNSSIDEAPLYNITADTNVFQTSLFGDQYNFVELKGTHGTASVCNGSFCCQVKFARNVYTDRFVLGAFFGRHKATMFLGMQVCALLKCPDISAANCGQLTQPSETYFTSLMLKGDFDTRYVFPEILVTNNGTAALPYSDWSFNHRVLRSEQGFAQPLLSAALIGRVYSLDGSS